jgi:hypothetical protein
MYETNKKARQQQLPGPLIDAVDQDRFVETRPAGDYPPISHDNHVTIVNPREPGDNLGMLDFSPHFTTFF